MNKMQHKRKDTNHWSLAIFSCTLLIDICWGIWFKEIKTFPGCCPRPLRSIELMIFLVSKTTWRRVNSKTTSQRFSAGLIKRKIQDYKLYMGPMNWFRSHKIFAYIKIEHILNQDDRDLEKTVYSLLNFISNVETVYKITFHWN